MHHKKNNKGKVTNEDYITTKWLFIVLNNSVHVNSMIIQSPDFALNSITLSNGTFITHLVHIHGDRIRIQPIKGCANSCHFCNLNKLKYQLTPIKDLEEAFVYAKENAVFSHVLISGGSPLNTQDDFDYLSNVYKCFGEKYRTYYPIDVMFITKRV